VTKRESGMSGKLKIVFVAGVLVANSAFAAGGGGSAPSYTPSPEKQVDVKAEYRAGLEAIDAKDFKGAIKHLKVVAEAAPKSADVQNYLGYSYRKSGDSKAALKYYLKALKIMPTHAGANEYLGELYLEQKNLPKAEERMAALTACCATTPQAKQLMDALAEYKAGGTFTAKPPMLSY
jgi:tetratricopeptide (TPR) repeat protein